MSQVTTGVRAILSHPLVYNTMQRLMGSERGRKLTVREYVRPRPGMRILDLGCGPAEILAFLPDDVAYVGYDMSSEYIEAARRRFGSRGTFHCRLLQQAEVAAQEPYDVVLGLGILHHLDDDSARKFMSLAAAALSRGGRICTVDPCFAPGQNPLARFLISRDRGQHVRDADGYRALPMGIAAEIEGRVEHQSWIPYTRWRMECRVDPGAIS